MPALRIHTIDFGEARSLFGSGEEKRCALILKSIPKGGEDARALSRAVTALICGAEGQVLSDAEPFGNGAVRRLDPVLAEAFRIILSQLARGLSASIAHPRPELPGPLDGMLRRLCRRPLFGVDSGAGPAWGGLSREEGAAFAAALPPSPEPGTGYGLLREKAMEAARDGLGLLSLESD